MPNPLTTGFPLPVIIFCCVAILLLSVSLFILIRITKQLRELDNWLKKTNRFTKLVNSSEEPNISKAEPGTPFDEFLSEDPERRNLKKKEQFKAYRKWRAENGLNWSKSDPAD